MFKLIGIVIKDLYRRPFKTIVFSLMVSAGIGALILTSGMNASVNDTVNSSIVNSLYTRKINIGISNPEGKTEEELTGYLKTIPHIQSVNRYTASVAANIADDDILSAGGYMLKSEPAEYLPKVVHGHSLNDNDKNMAIIPQKLFINTDRYKPEEIINTGKLLGRDITIVYTGSDGKSKYEYGCRVAGIFANQIDNNSNEIYIPLNDMYKVCANIGLYNSTKASLFTAIVDEQQFVDAIIEKLSSMDGIEAELSDTSNRIDPEPYKQLLKVSDLMAYCIIFFIASMLYLCVTNIAISNKKGIALYKAIGYNNHHIFIMTFIESLIISLIGYLLGILIAVLSGSLIINPLIFARTRLVLSISITFLSCIIPLVLIVITTFIVSSLVYLKIKNIYPAILFSED